jgi:dipeptidyl aminopeptidase/acylaminoacyl peptidase
MSRYPFRLGVLVALLSSLAVQAQGTQEDYDRSSRFSRLTQGKVFKATVEPHWFAGGTRFWYRNDLPESSHEFILVDAVAGKRATAFDHARLAAALANASGEKVKAARLPFERIEVDGDMVKFRAFGKSWSFDRTKNELKTAETKPEPEVEPTPVDETASQPARAENPWSVVVKDNNLFLRKTNGDDEVQLTKDGTADDSYSARVTWSPDRTKFVSLKTQKGEERKISFVESSPRDQLQPKVHTMTYAKPGDKLAVAKPHLFDTATKKEIPVSDELFPNPWSLDRIRWDRDGKEFTFLYNQRGHQVLRRLAVDAATGKVRAVIDETSKTFVDYAHKNYLHEVDDTGELIWMSERDGWCHLYLIDGKTGQVKNQITKGEWIVRGVERVDDRKRQLWLRVAGIYPEQDPYYIHYARINFDGTGLVKMTEGDGSHSIRYSPDGRFYLDSYSRIDMPGVTELRRTEDGKLICKLEEGDMSALVAAGWQVPERFVAKGRDGKTDIHGVIYRPTNFDAKKRYPVIEQIYAGPQGSFVPKTFRAFHYPQEMAELGFITVQIDGMGTSNRSKAFHDVCAKNLADAGFPDRILWLKAAAAKYPSLDLSRVGVYGGSAGGQNALGALLTHGDFYKVAAADCGCHDNRMDKVWWNELWMSYPIGPHYAAQSNVTMAHKLTGKLLLTVGEMDRNVDPASTMQVVNALIKAGKDFDLIVFPGGGHGSGGGAYGARRRKDFFVKHLLGVEPPDRNAVSLREGQEEEQEAEPFSPDGRP